MIWLHCAIMHLLARYCLNEQDWLPLILSPMSICPSNQKKGDRSGIFFFLSFMLLPISIHFPGNYAWILFKTKQIRQFKELVSMSVDF